MASIKCPFDPHKDEIMELLFIYDISQLPINLVKSARNLLLAVKKETYGKWKTDVMLTIIKANLGETKWNLIKTRFLEYEKLEDQRFACMNGEFLKQYMLVESEDVSNNIYDSFEILFQISSVLNDVVKYTVPEKAPEVQPTQNQEEYFGYYNPWQWQ